MGLEENWFRLNSLDFLFYCWWKNNFWIWRVAKHEKQEQEYWIIRIKIEVILFVKVWFFSVWENKFGYIKFNSFNNYIYLWRGYFFLRIIQWKLEKKDGKYKVSNLHFQRHNHCSKSRIHISQKYTPINSIIYVNLKDQYSFKFSNFQILSIRER